MSAPRDPDAVFPPGEGIYYPPKGRGEQPKGRANGAHSGAQPRRKDADDIPWLQDAPLAFKSLADFHGKPIEPVEWLVPNLIPMGFVTGLYGDGGIGKTTLAMQLMIAGVRGLDWLGMEVRRGPALGVFAEDPERVVLTRAQKMCDRMGLEFRDLADLHFVTRVGQDTELAIFDHDTQAMKPTLRFMELRKRALSLRPASIILDNAGRAFGGNENDRRQVMWFAGQLLAGLAEECGAALVMLGHPSRAGLANGRMNSGSTGWNNAVRARIGLRASDPEKDAQPDPKARVVQPYKQNLGPLVDAIAVRFEEGIFVLANGIGAEPHAGSTSTATEIDVAFLAGLDAITKQGRTLSPSAAARDAYAPLAISRFRSATNAPPIPMKALTAAMDRLLAASRICVTRDNKKQKLARKEGA